MKNLTKVFSSHTSTEEAMRRLKQGQDKTKILAETGSTVGVNQVSFDVKEGELFVIMGLSGSGKSTLIRLINRLIEPTTGEIYIDDENIAQMDKNELIMTRRKKLGMVFQNFALLPHRTVLSNVEYGLEIQGISKHSREKTAKRALETVGLSGYEDSYPDQLSGGMKQRVGLARALANGSDILLMDEAFSALDPLIRSEMQDELILLQSQLKKTVLFITHDLDEALKLGDRIAIMKDGNLIQVGTPEEILTYPADDYVSAFIRDIDRSKVLTAEHVMKKPDVITTWRDGARIAIKKMNDAGLSSIFVVDRERKLKGLLTIDSAIEALNNNKWVEEMLIQHFHSTAPDTPLQDLIPVAAQTKYPIAVVENGQLKGIIVRVTILAGLIRGNEGGNKQ